ncbi:MAG TPA: RNA 2',3'-cyclic phosphodiesterase [Burkholderiales bacterium]|nr:RNA 2',3'-cyclic phosphodiesterase [Burkholderiales bacterium]
MRSYFFALFPPARVRDQIAEIASALNQQHHLKARLIRADNLHLTLAFLGRVKGHDPELVKSAVASGDRAQKHAFELTLDHAQTFDRRSEHPLVMLCSEIPSALRSLHAALGDLDREYRPHFTIGYTRERLPKTKLPRQVVMPAPAFALATRQPEMRDYTQLHNWTLD